MGNTGTQRGFTHVGNTGTQRRFTHVGNTGTQRRFTHVGKPEPIGDLPTWETPEPGQVRQKSEIYAC